MKKILLIALAVTTLVGCQAVRVTQDYAPETNFKQYTTFAFYKEGIDEDDISELDKKRILRAIDAEMTAKGFTKSDNPDIIVNFFTDSKERLDVFNNMGWGMGGGFGGFGGWGGWGGGFGNNVSRVTEGVLYIDLIDTRKKELIWQGIGTAALKNTPIKKIERTNEMVKEILMQFPPFPRK